MCEDVKNGYIAPLCYYLSPNFRLIVINIFFKSGQREHQDDGVDAGGNAAHSAACRAGKVGL